MLRDDFNEDSDIDFLYVFFPDAKWGLKEWLRMEDQLQKLVSRDIDLVSKQSIENSHNWIRRRNILGSAKIIYARFG
ncbi:hypothetical protein CFPU101_24740 [Chroococcus sp. FPU101]|nr:hypothetical protein CFPU101_24740 [Chroococcus sp. FPU101]